MGDKRSREKIDYPWSKKDNFEEDRLLSPIEEESESSRGEQSADYTGTTEAEDNSYRTVCFRYNDYRGDSSKNYDRNRKNTPKSSSLGESTSGEEGNVSANCCFQMCDRSKLETEASGDNDDARRSSSPRNSSKDNTSNGLKRFESKLLQCETDIAALRKQFGLEKFQNRRYALQCYEKHAQTQNILKNDLQEWKNNLDARIKAQIVRWQLDERKRISEEIAKVTGMCSQEITKTLQKSMNEWQEKDSKKMTELIHNERIRQDIETQNTRKVYEKIEKHLENLEKRNRNSYLNFRKQMNAWEERLKEEVIRLHENGLQELRQQPKFWHSDQNGFKYGSVKTPVRTEVSSCLQRRCKDQDYDLPEENSLVTKFRETNAKDLRRLEQLFKFKLQNQRDDLTKLLTTKFAELWKAFEQFKHNFRLDRRYREYEYSRNSEEPETFASSVVTDQADEDVTNTATNTDQENERRTRIPGKR